jgi:hypothetical protein
MRISAVAATMAACALAALAPSAAAETIELGQTKSPIVAPTCAANLPPAQCTIILTRSTALQTMRDGVVAPTRVHQPGVIVAFTVGLSALSSDPATAKADIHELDVRYGGTTRAAITVLKPVGRPKLNQWQVVAESPLFHLEPYLGTVVQFPLADSLGAPGTPPMAAPLPVAKGDVIALTVPTWAPVLSFGLSTSQFGYRQSRRANCPHPAAAQQAQVTLGQEAMYRCEYAGTSVEYTATEITTPTPATAPNAPVHKTQARKNKKKRPTTGTTGRTTTTRTRRLVAGRRVRARHGPRADRRRHRRVWGPRRGSG